MMAEQIRNRLSPEWLRDCVMVDSQQSALIVSPKACLKHGLTNVKITQGKFTAKTIFQIRLDFDLIKIKKEEPL
jgi:hypothetical protein